MIRRGRDDGDCVPVLVRVMPKTTGNDVFVPL